MAIRATQNSGAGNEARTRDLNLGKVALYQLSYSRAARDRILSPGQRKSRQDRDFFALGMARFSFINRKISMSDADFPVALLV